MRRVSMGTRDELIAALAGRYGEAGRIERGRILDEFVASRGITASTRCGVAIGTDGVTARTRPGRRIYGEAVRAALILLWEASDRVCGKRLKALLPVLMEAMERHGRLELDPVVRAGVLAMSAATIDRALAPCREARGQGGVGARQGCRACGGSFRCGRSPIGPIRCPVLSKRTWSCTAARPRAAVMCRPWF